MLLSFLGIKMNKKEMLKIANLTKLKSYKPLFMTILAIVKGVNPCLTMKFHK